ncbi:MAG: PD40 domain-containing protein [Saprospiraceae bacterium]|nr:PD40 domain-containing protein [Saprospiraceae bacterium]
MKTQVFTMLMVIFGLTSVSAQKSLYKAKLQYDTGSFTEAKTVLLDYISEVPADVDAHLLLAKCYFSMGLFSECNLRLEKIVHLNNCPSEAFELYGKSLKQVGRMTEAKDNFLKLASVDPTKSKQLAESVDFAIQTMEKGSKYDIISMPYNSSSHDFGLTFYQNVPVFTSFRTDILMDEVQKLSNQHDGVQKSYFYSNKKHHFIKGLHQKLDQIGPLSFSSNGEYCTLIESGMTQDCHITCDKISSVLYLVKINKTGEIVEHKSFIHNEVGSSIHSAHIAYDGKAIYFSSNRPGGYGGFDLYVSYLKNGLWTLPVNLGSEVNTSGNEITPFYNNGEMLFASDNHPGLGGYDVFSSRVIQGQWTEITNAGHGINSIGDDYFPVKNSKEDIFITSNRLGGKGGNDIYKAIQIVGDNEALLSAVEVNIVPPAVSLASLEETHAQKPVSETKNVSFKENSTVVTTDVQTKSVFIMPEFDRNVVGSTEAEFSLSGARRIALGNVAPVGEVFFIQLASTSNLEPNLSKYGNLVQFGDIYKMTVNNVIKIRLGYFTERKDAEEALKNVRQNGFKDAFIIKESLVHSNMELLLSKAEDPIIAERGNDQTNNKKQPAAVYGLGGKYKVRLASYEDPIWFDINKVKDLGRIEQWTKGSWTIFVLAGYNDIEEAKDAQIKALNRGFKTAEVVIDTGGILERLKQN